MSIVVVGQSSFTAHAIRERYPYLHWIWLSHREALSSNDWIEQADCVINLAFAPQFRAGPYNATIDIDSLLAHRIADHPIHYIMASSRMVYGPGPEKFGLSEDAPLQPTNAYGRNKIEIEKSLQSILPHDRLTILRSSNIFGHELNRDMFFGRMLTKLKNEKTIVFDMSADSIRDFCAVWHQADALKAIAEDPVGGVFNFGSGFGVSCGDIAAWVMEGFDEGKLIVTGDHKGDQFWLNTEKLLAAYPTLTGYTPARLRDDCLECGRWLSHL